MDKTAIVILNWNGLEYLKKFLGLVTEYSSLPHTSVWLADNGSADGSVEWVSANLPQVKIISLNENHGFAGGYNLALGQIDAEYYVLINSDIEVTTGWLSPLISFLDSHPEVAAVQPKILSLYRRTHFEYAGASGGYIDKYGFTFCRGRIFHTTEEDKGQYNDVAEVFWTSGACMMIRASAWKECGGLDPDFFAHMEEIDMCWRLHNMGWKLYAVPLSVVYHAGGGALPYNSPMKTFLNFRNNLFLLYKNLPSGKLRKILLKRKIMDLLAFIFFILQGKPVHAIQIVKAHIHYLNNVRSLKKKREIYPGNHENYSKTKTILNRSLVFEFYIKRNKTYASLIKYFN